MMTDIEEQINELNITDIHHSLITTTPDNTSDKGNTTSVFSEQTMNNRQREKQLRRISLPADTYRKSKFASWIQQCNIPSPPCRNNSQASRTSIRSSASDQTTSTPSLSPTTSPTSIDTPPLPTPNSLTDQLPPRTSSLHPAPSSSSSSFNSTHDEEEQEQEQQVTPLRSTSTPDHEKKKKRFIPLVSRIRERSSKKLLDINPPEPPPQLLLSALHCNDQEIIDNHTTASSSPLYDVDYQMGTPSTPMSSIAESPTSFDWTETQHARLSFPGGDDDKSLSSTTDSSLRVRRRSSCPLMTTTQQECVMLRSFCSTTNSSIPASLNTTPSPLAVAQDVYDEYQQCVLSFSTMKPRSRPLRRKTSGKREKRALRSWHDTLVALLKAEQDDDGTSSHKSPSTLSMDQLSNEKRERYALTRKFILREFYLTEVTFWNQLYYSKVMFFDPLQLSLDRHSTFTRTSDLDLFSNLPDLMQCSSQLIRSMAPFLDHSFTKCPSIPSTPSSSYQDLTSINSITSSSSSITTTTTSQSTLFDHHHHQQRRPLSHHDSFSSVPSSPTSSISSSTSSNINTNMLPIHLHADTRTLTSPPPPSSSDSILLLGKEICAMANQFVVFLRWALDYKVNRKKLDHRSQHNKGFATYQEKLSMRKETNQFHVHDYLIIPIQRITRYGLLLADLQKHTEKDHPDYHHINRARIILTSLAVAMNKAQQK